MDDAAVRGWIDDRAAEGLFTGSVLVWRDRRPVFEHVAGLAHRALGVPVAAGTRFLVASISKLVTAATVLRLVDRGLLTLDTPVVTVLPPEHRTAAMTGEHTVWHLLTHTSGLPNYHVTEDETWDSFLAAWDRVPPYKLREPADMLPLFADRPAAGPPGVLFRYADANFILLGLVIEALTGRRFADAAREEVLAPAGMADSGFEQLDEGPARLAMGYLADDGRTHVHGIPVGGMPDGGLITTPRDLARLIDALLDGTLLAPATAEAMFSQQAPRTPGYEGCGRYGLGAELAADENGEIIILGHDGCDPGVRANLSHYRADGTTIAVLSNQDSGVVPIVLGLAAELGLHDPRDWGA
ncbi:MAG TPA: serine hydrolase domain-containing protein [Pseudonocardiaceae bacterium]